MEAPDISSTHIEDELSDNVEETVQEKSRQNDDAESADVLGKPDIWLSRVPSSCVEEDKMVDFSLFADEVLEIVPEKSGAGERSIDCKEVLLDVAPVSSIIPVKRSSNIVKPVEKNKTETQKLSKVELTSVLSKKAITMSDSESTDIYCKHCDSHFIIKSDFNDHICTNNPTEKVHSKFNCSYCNKSINSASKLFIHLEVIHNVSYFSCKQCKLKFTSASSINKHLLSKHHENDKFVCDICSVTFKTKHLVLKHIKTHHIKSSKDILCFKCKICDLFFTSEEIVKSHIEIHYKDNPLLKIIKNHSFFTGKNSLYTFENNLKFNTVNLEEKSVTTKSEVKCKQCWICKLSRNCCRQSKYHGQLEQYIRSKSFECLTCGQMFFNKTEFQQHLKTHNTEKPYNPNSRHLKLDNNSSNQVSSKNKVICLDLEQITLKKTVPTIIRKKPRSNLLTKSTCTKCIECPTSFASMDSLKTHFALKHDDTKFNVNKYFQCKLCPSVFKYSKMLEDHVIIIHFDTSDTLPPPSKCLKLNSYPVFTVPSTITPMPQISQLSPPKYQNVGPPSLVNSSEWTKCYTVINQPTMYQTLNSPSSNFPVLKNNTIPNLNPSFTILPQKLPNLNPLSVNLPQNSPNLDPVSVPLSKNSPDLESVTEPQNSPNLDPESVPLSKISPNLESVTSPQNSPNLDPKSVPISKISPNLESVTAPQKSPNLDPVSVPLPQNNQTSPSETVPPPCPFPSSAPVPYVTLTSGEMLLRTGTQFTPVIIQCAICPKTVLNQEDLFQHYIDNHNGAQDFGIVKCENCQKYFIPGEEASVLCDSCKEQNVVSKCHLCPLELNNMSELNIHLIDVHNTTNDIYICQKCKIGFKTSCSLKIHKRLHGKNYKVHDPVSVIKNVIWYKCEVCSEHFKDSTEFFSHCGNRKCYPELLNQCHHCDLKFKTKSEKKQHKKEVHNFCTNVRVEKLHIHCDNCHKDLHHSMYFGDEHFDKCLQTKNLCPLCGKLVEGKNNFYVKGHIRSHAGNIIAVQCETCQIYFCSQHNLNSHTMQKHVLGII